jgi:hypothetical protein
MHSEEDGLKQRRWSYVSCYSRAQRLTITLADIEEEVERTSASIKTYRQYLSAITKVGYIAYMLIIIV